MIKQQQPGTQIPGCCSMYAPPKTAVLVSVVLSFVPVAGGTFLRLEITVLYDNEKTQSFAFNSGCFYMGGKYYLLNNAEALVNSEYWPVG